MTQATSTDEYRVQLSEERLIEKVCSRFETAWKTGQRPRIEDYLSELPESRRLSLVGELVALDIDYRRLAGENPKADDYRARFPFLKSDWLCNHVAVKPAPIKEPRREAGQTEPSMANSVCPVSSTVSDAEHAGLGMYSVAALVQMLRDCRILEPAQMNELSCLQVKLAESVQLVEELLQRGWLTRYQVDHLLRGRGQKLVLGAYVLLDKLGEGGMGEVYKARHQNLGRIVALKVIRKERLSNADAVRRFQREVQAVARLAHPHIITAFDADQIGSTHFLVMEYCEGIDLGRLVRQSGPLPIAQACEYIRQAALGLQHAHEQGMVHRDIKPANLLLIAGGATVKLLDLGLARLDLDASEQSSTGPLTQEGMVMGTFDYIAPEQATDSHSVDIRADLYSLGCTLYYLLTGRVPFTRGSGVQKLLMHQLDEPSAVEQARPEVPVGLAAIVRKLMAKQPKDRYQTPAEVAAALAPWTGMERAERRGKESAPEGAQSADPAFPAEPLAQFSAAAGQASRATAGGWSSMVSAPASANCEPVPRNFVERLRRIAERQSWLLLSAAGGALVVVILFLALPFRSGPQQERSPTNPEPATESQGTKVDADARKLKAWEKFVAALPAKKQVEAVAKKLVELNPGFDGKVTSNILNGQVTEFNFVTDTVEHIWPVRGLRALERLNCSGTEPGKGKLSDLSSLKGLPLTEVECYNTSVSDLFPLKKMALTRLYCGATNVSDLAPLTKMPLQWLNISGTSVMNLAALKGLPLQSLDCGRTEVSDLSPLKGMPLRQLFCFKSKTVDLSPLKGMPLEVLNCSGTAVASLAPLKGMALTNLDCNYTKIVNLAPLTGVPLTILDCGGTKVSDLSPLKDMPLEGLNCSWTDISDLSPLKGCQLRRLNCGGTKILDLSPLKGMPLEELQLQKTEVSDLSPLKDMPLKQLWGDFKLETNAQILRSIKTLEKINGKEPEAYWEDLKKPAVDGAPAGGPRTVEFAGHSWDVKSAASHGPGPNAWSNSNSNVWVDDKGYLHLAILHNEDRWYCAEVALQRSLGYGNYQWSIAGEMAQLDKQTVFGVFLYADDDHEMELELARWGQAEADNAQFVLQPATKDTTHLFSTGDARELTCRLEWQPGQAKWECWRDQDTCGKPLATWTFSGTKVPRPGGERVRANLWLFRGKPPGTEVKQEMVIRSFTFNPSK